MSHSSEETPYHQTRLNFPSTFHTLAKHDLTFPLKAEEEDIQMVHASWNINQMKIEMLPETFLEQKPWEHAIRVTTTSPTEEAQQRVRLMTRWPFETVLPLNDTHISMKMLFWNCRGAGNQNFRDAMRDICTDHHPQIVVLFETKVGIQAMDNFFTALGFSESAHVDPVGRSGGIWVLWNPAAVTLHPIHISPQVIHLMVMRNNYEDWLLSAVYASPNHKMRDYLWSNLHMIADSCNLPWLVAGDFNDYLGAAEKRSIYYPTSSSRQSKFANNINSCNLSDIGCSGPKLTWSNNRRGFTNTLIRLDRALANPDWRLRFPEASVTNLPRIYSDHCPMLVVPSGSIKINTDGSCDNEERRGGFGGLARSSNGKWIEGFCGYIGCADPMTAELRGILQGLDLCRQRNWRNVYIETDCKNAVDLINGGAIQENHPQGTLIEDCRDLKRETGAIIGHVGRECNQCADSLAKMGANQCDPYVRLLIPPNEVIEEMECDIRGVEYGRNN